MRCDQTGMRSVLTRIPGRTYADAVRRSLSPAPPSPRRAELNHTSTLPVCGAANVAHEEPADPTGAAPAQTPASPSATEAQGRTETLTTQEDVPTTPRAASASGRNPSPDNAMSGPGVAPWDEPSLEEHEQTTASSSTAAHVAYAPAPMRDTSQSFVTGFPMSWERSTPLRESTPMRGGGGSGNPAIHRPDTPYPVAPPSPPPEQMPTFDTSITPRPADGWPPVHIRDPDDAFFLQNKAQAEAWKTYAGPKVGIQLYDKPFTATGEVTGIILRVLAIAGFTKVRISPPIATAYSKNGPNTALIYGITQEVADALYDTHCISTIAGSVVMVPLGAILPTFICTLQGLATDDETEIKGVVQTHFSGGDIGRTILHFVEEHPDFQGLPPHEARDRILQTIQIIVWRKKFSNGIDVPMANVHMQTPTLELTRWRFLRDIIARHQFTHTIYGTGTCARVHHCGGCRGAGHPRGLCPYPLLPAWNGPGVTAFHNDDDYVGVPTHLLGAQGGLTRTNGGQGTRGRGRGPVRGRTHT